MFSPICETALDSTLPTHFPDMLGLFTHFPQEFAQILPLDYDQLSFTSELTICLVVFRSAPFPLLALLASLQTTFTKPIFSSIEAKGCPGRKWEDRIGDEASLFPSPSLNALGGIADG